MAVDERKEREDQAWEALIIACFAEGLAGCDSHDNPDLLDEDDRKVMDAMGSDLVDRIAGAILSGQQFVSPSSKGAFQGDPFADVTNSLGADFGSLGPAFAALHRGDDQLTPEAIEEMKHKAKEFFGQHGD
jgi:hypothetical protein